MPTINLQEELFQNIDQVEQKFQGPQTIDEMLVEFLMAEARKSGFVTGFKAKELEVKAEKEKEVKRYFSIAFNLVAFINYQFSKTDMHVEILETRIINPFTTKNFSIFFLIKCENDEDEFLFGQFLADIKKGVLTNDKIYFEAFSVRKSENLDLCLIQNDYPFKINL